MPTIGQWDPVGDAIVTELEKDGSLVLASYLKTQVPFFGLPIISTIVGYICDWISKCLIQNIDNLVYAGFIAFKTGKQVSDYVKAQDSGDQSDIDKNADRLIHLGDV